MTDTPAQPDVLTIVMTIQGRAVRLSSPDRWRRAVTLRDLCRDSIVGVELNGRPAGERQAGAIAELAPLFDELDPVAAAPSSGEPPGDIADQQNFETSSSWSTVIPLPFVPPGSQMPGRAQDHRPDSATAMIAASSAGGASDPMFAGTSNAVLSADSKSATTGGRPTAEATTSSNAAPESEAEKKGDAAKKKEPRKGPWGLGGLGIVIFLVVRACMAITSRLSQPPPPPPANTLSQTPPPVAPAPTTVPPTSAQSTPNTQSAQAPPDNSMGPSGASNEPGPSSRDSFPISALAGNWARLGGSCDYNIAVYNGNLTMTYGGTTSTGAVEATDKQGSFAVQMADGRFTLQLDSAINMTMVFPDGSSWTMSRCES